MNFPRLQKVPLLKFYKGKEKTTVLGRYMYMCIVMVTFIAFVFHIYGWSNCVGSWQNKMFFYEKKKFFFWLLFFNFFLAFISECACDRLINNIPINNTNKKKTNTKKTKKRYFANSQNKISQVSYFFFLQLKYKNTNTK